MVLSQVQIEQLTKSGHVLNRLRKIVQELPCAFTAQHTEFDHLWDNFLDLHTSQSNLTYPLSQYPRVRKKDRSSCCNYPISIESPDEDLRSIV